MKKSNSEIQILFDTVVKGGYCIGCGACAAVKNSNIKIKFDQFGKLQAFKGNTVKKESFEENSLLRVCPFSSECKNEDEIGEELYGRDNEKDDKLGYVNSTYAGYTNEPKYRDNGSSGGIGTWILSELFTRGLIDHVAHIHQNIQSADNNALFIYHISDSLEEIEKGAKSRYYPVEISEVVKNIREKEGKYAIVGLPCFIKAIRLLMYEDKILSDRIKYCIGLVCGHLKSAHFASMWGWQMGIHPYDLKSINFRKKLDGYGANQYGISVSEEVEGQQVFSDSPPLKALFGANWGWGLFKYKACDYCDDVVAETSDITIGDAWLPQYVRDSKGTNIVIVREKTLSSVIQNGYLEGKLKLDKLSSDDIIASQSSGFTHRREGLSYRLFLLEQNNQWHPPKRVIASDKLISKKIKKRQELRMRIAEESHFAFQKAIRSNKFQVFREELQPLLQVYERLYKPSLFKQVKIVIKRKLRL